MLRAVSDQLMSQVLKRGHSDQCKVRANFFPFNIVVLIRQYWRNVALPRMHFSLFPYLHSIQPVRFTEVSQKLREKLTEKSYSTEKTACVGMNVRPWEPDKSVARVLFALADASGSRHVQTVLQAHSHSQGIKYNLFVPLSVTFNDINPSGKHLILDGESNWYRFKEWESLWGVGGRRWMGQTRLDFHPRDCSLCPCETKS